MSEPADGAGREDKVSAIGTLMATAALTVGVVAAAKAIKKQASKVKKRMEQGAEATPVVDFERQDATGVWGMPDAPSGAKGPQ